MSSLNNQTVFLLALAVVTKNRGYFLPINQKITIFLFVLTGGGNILSMNSGRKLKRIFWALISLVRLSSLFCNQQLHLAWGFHFVVIYFMTSENER